MRELCEEFEPEPGRKKKYHKTHTPTLRATQTHTYNDTHTGTVTHTYAHTQTHQHTTFVAESTNVRNMMKMMKLSVSSSLCNFAAHTLVAV